MSRSILLILSWTDVVAHLQVILDVLIQNPLSMTSRRILFQISHCLFILYATSREYVSYENVRLLAKIYARNYFCNSDRLVSSVGFCLCLGREGIEIFSMFDNISLAYTGKGMDLKREIAMLTFSEHYLKIILTYQKII